MATDPYKYLDQMRARTSQPSAAPDPFEADLQRQRDDELSYRIKVARPDEDARVRPIAEARGLPPSVVAGQLSAFEAEGRAARAKSAMQEYPAIGRWSAKPGNAAIAADDYDNLGLLGKAFYGVKLTGSNISKTVEAGLYDLTSSMWGTLSAIAQNASDVSPVAAAQRTIFGGSVEQGIASFADARAREGRAMADAANPEVKDWTARNLLQGVRSLPTTAGAIVVGLVAGPTAGASVAGISTGGGEYLKARDKGLSASKAGVYAVSQGAVEILTERLPVSNLVGDLVKKSPLAKTFFRQLAAEVPGEQAATILQDFNEWAVLNPEKPFQSYRDARISRGVETFVATVGGVGAASSISVASERTVRVASKVLERRQQSINARNEAAFLNQIAEATAKSKLARRSPDVLAELAQQLGEDAGFGSIFIPAEAVGTYLTSDDDNAYFGEPSCLWRI